MGSDEAYNEDFASRDVVFSMLFAQAYPMHFDSQRKTYIYSENVWLFQT